MGEAIVGGRGRGRGRSRVNLPIDEDVPDGCAVRRTEVRSLHQQMGFSNGIDLKQTVGLKEQMFMKVPDRFINRNRKIPSTILQVDVEKREVLVCFYDPETMDQRNALADTMREFCESAVASNYLLRQEEVSGDEVVIIKDTCDNYRRTRITNGSSDDLSSLIDLDGRVTGLKFQGISTKIFRIPFENKKLQLWFQAMRCKVALGKPEAIPMNLWAQHNNFIFSSNQWTENCMLAALEGSRCPINLTVSNMTLENDKPTIFIDIFQTAKLQNDFLMAVKYCSVPRTPMIGQERPAVITNIRRQGLIDVVLYDSILISLREVLKKLQSENPNFVRDALDLALFYKELIDGFEIRNFLAILPGENTQLHRVQVLGIEFEKDVKVLFIDVGKEMIIPLTSLIIPYNGCKHKDIPQLLELISPQAITLDLKGFNNKNDESILISMRKSLEFRPCFVEIVEDASGVNQHPIAIVRTDIMPSEVVSVMDYVHSHFTENIRATGATAKNQRDLKVLKAVATKLGFNNN
ncbi:hypothetical protein Ocin01_05897, partial [Orchesella cincta]